MHALKYKKHKKLLKSTYIVVCVHLNPGSHTLAPHSDLACCLGYHHCSLLQQLGFLHSPHLYAHLLQAGRAFTTVQQI